MKYLLSSMIFLCATILIASISYDTNYAEAKSDTEPCSYLNPHSFLKISNDPWTCEKVDYWVPEKCGIYAGLYKTDKQCQPPPPPPTEERDSDGDGIKNSQDACPNEQETLNGYRDNDGCPDEKPLTQQPEPSIPQKEQLKSSIPTPSLPDDIVNMIIYAVVGIIIVAIIVKKLKNQYE